MASTLRRQLQSVSAHQWTWTKEFLNLMRGMRPRINLQQCTQIRLDHTKIRWVSDTQDKRSM